MNSSDRTQLLARHEAFLERRPVDRALIGPWPYGYYPAEQFPRGAKQWCDNAIVRPQELFLAAFADDYECLYKWYCEHASDSDFGFIGSPYWGMPWLEAIMGCPVTATATNCRAGRCLASLDDADDFSPDLDANPWFAALVRFTTELVKQSAGRFPVCPPLLRGPGDAAAAMLGEMDYITSFYDQPDRIRTLLHRCAQVRTSVLRQLDEQIPPWQGVHAVGGYPSTVWSQRSVAYHQEDSAAVLNPSIFRAFLLPALKLGCDAAEVNFIHLHSACLYPIDILLQDDSFDILEINVDHRGMGPPVCKLIDTFRKIQAAGRPLVLWGEFSNEDWELIHTLLSPTGLSLQPIIRFPPADGTISL